MAFRMRPNTAMNLARGWIRGRIVDRPLNRPFVIEPFTLEEFCQGIGYDPELAKERNEVYYKVIEYWRRKGLLYWDELENQGKITGTPEEKWNKFLWYYNGTWDAYIFFYDHDMQSEKGVTGCYIQPILPEKEIIDQKRAIRQLDGLIRVLKEMETYGERLLLTGKSVPKLTKTEEALRRKFLKP